MKPPTPIGWRTALRERLDDSHQATTPTAPTTPMLSPALLARLDGGQLLLLARLAREQRDPLTAGTLPTADLTVCRKENEMPPPVTINVTITQTLSCPDCGCARIREYANSRTQSQCLACGCLFHAEHAPKFNGFDDLLAATNEIPEVEFGSLHDQVFAGRGW